MNIHWPSFWDGVTSVPFRIWWFAILSFHGVKSAFWIAFDATNDPPGHTPKTTRTVACCNCGTAVDTREVENGGSPEGAQFSDGDWVCSSECWDVAK
jgi:hypothetical protein